MPTVRVRKKNVKIVCVCLEVEVPALIIVTVHNSKYAWKKSVQENLVNYPKSVKNLEKIFYATN